MRLFAALELPDAVREKLLRWGAGVVRATAGLRLLPPQSLHVTLCFLGGQDAGEVDAILAAAAAAASLPAAPLRLAESLWLPRRAPRVLAVALRDPEAKLAAVQAHLSTALAAGGWYVPERRPFLAHVTVARVRAGARVRAMPLEPPQPVALVGRSVTLYRSRLSRGGARYEPLGSVQLAEAEGVAG